MLGVNTDETSSDRTDQFIRQVGFQQVLDDLSWTLYAQFGPGNSASRYVIINGVADSPTHKQWEVLVNQVYFDPRKPEILRAFIDKVKPAAQTPPAITVQPESKTVLLGSSVTLSVSATGTAPLVYQWFKNAVIIPGATSPDLTFPSITQLDAGDYSVSVSNSAGSVTSQPGSVKIRQPIRPSLSALRRMQNGRTEFLLSGEPGRRYHIEFSTDLNVWSRAGTLSAGDSAILYNDDSAASGPSHRFYRAVSE